MLKTNLTKFVVIGVKWRQKAGFSGPISSKITLTKQKERRKRKSEEDSKTLPPNGPFVSNIFFSKVAIIKAKSATIAFFSSPPFFLLALSFSPFLFLRYCEFGACGTLKKRTFWRLVIPMTANFIRLVFKTPAARYIYIYIYIFFFFFFF